MKRRAVLSLVVSSALVAWPSAARAGDVASRLSAAERGALAKGEVVERALRFERGGAEYVGGVAYVVIDAPVGAVMAVLLDVQAYRTFMPMTLEAAHVARTQRELWIRLKHGNRLGEAGYTVRVRRDGGRTLRFWLDPRHPHDIDDLWGYWRVQKLDRGRTLLTYAAALDLGFGMLRVLFEERIRARAMTTPGRLREYVEERWRKSRAPLPRRLPVDTGVDATELRSEGLTTTVAASCSRAS
jgi:hypothetical protein